MTAASRRSISTSSEGPLRCRTCGIPHPPDERFCRDCGRPLVLGDGEEPGADEASRRARKVNPRLSRGEPQQVAVVANMAEGELVQGILLEEGIPSYLRRSAGFDVADFLAAGPRDVMVPASAVAAARELLTGQADLPEPEVTADPARAALRLAAALLIALLIFSAVAGGLWAIGR